MKTLKLTSIILTLAIFIACDNTTELYPEQPSHPELNMIQFNTDNAEENAGLAMLRQATARYHDVEAAIADGFVQVLPCQANPEGEGGLGIPFINPDRLDRNIDLSEPEVLFYEPQKNGKLRLIGAEPVVPIEMWDENESEAPSLFGREFHRNEDHGLYGLHMWVWKHNPDGFFAFWHSNISCEFEE